MHGAAIVDIGRIGVLAFAQSNSAGAKLAEAIVNGAGQPPNETELSCRRIDRGACQGRSFSRPGIEVTSESEAKSIFISYSHEDKVWMEQFMTVLKPASRSNTIAVWWDGQMKPGQKWREEITSGMSSATAAVLLVSPNFLASDFILNDELPFLLRAAESSKVWLFWVLLRACLYKITPLKELEAAHKPLTPLNTLSESQRDAVWVQIAERISEALVKPSPSGATLPPRVEAAIAHGPATRPEPGSSKDDARGQMMLKCCDDFNGLDELGTYFILKEQWTNAFCAFDKLVKLATPNRPDIMAKGYGNLGLILRRHGQQYGRACECLNLSKNLFTRIGEHQKAEEFAQKLAELRRTEAENRPGRDTTGPTC